MVGQSNLILAVTAFAMVDSSFGFSVQHTGVVKTTSVTPRLQPLNVGATLDMFDDTQGDDNWLMFQQARDCASSDSCSLEAAEGYLSDVLHVQSACASGALVGNDDVCENVDVAAEIVANLRAKIALESSIGRRAVGGLKNSLPLTLGAVMILLSVIVASSSVTVSPDATPFTLQEWWWAMKGGYLPNMLEHYFRHGGLVVDDIEFPRLMPFTLQEWLWSIQGGYFPTMLQDFFHNGGFEVDNTVAAAQAVSPLTPQEWVWAVQGGYVDTLMEQYAKHGGLATLSSDTAAPAFTLQEWQWAVKGGYLNDMMGHYMRNGGV